MIADPCPFELYPWQEKDSESQPIGCNLCTKQKCKDNLRLNSQVKQLENQVKNLITSEGVRIA